MSTVFNKNLLSLAVCGAMAASALPAAVQAQDDSAQVEEIVVSGMRSSVSTAQDTKRYADTVMDVISATDIGALPDKSVTEALQRLPGVTIERFASSDDPKHYADEGTGVLVRGLDRVRSEINGRDAFSANPYGGLNYADFPAELLASVRVVKNQTADLISGGIAGTINLVTRKPFDSDEQLLSFNAKANYGDFREEWTPSFSALFSDRWENDAGEFGLLISGAYSNFKTRGDGAGLGNFHSRSDEFYQGSYDQWGTLQGAPGRVEGFYDSRCTPNVLGWEPNCEPVANLITETVAPPVDGPALPGQPEGERWYVPANYHMSTAENERERVGFTTALQWQNHEGTIAATLEHINSRANLEWRERVIANGDRGFVTGAGAAIIWEEDPENGYPITVDDRGFLTSGLGRVEDVNFPVSLRSRYNYNEDTVRDTSFNLKLTPTDRMTMSFDYQHVDSEQRVSNASMNNQTRGPRTSAVAPFFLDLRGGRPMQLEYLNDRLSNPTLTYDVDPETGEPLETFEPDLFLASGIQNEVHNVAQMDAVKFDFQYDFDGLFTAVKTGVYYADKDLTVRNTEYSGWTPIGRPWVQEGRMAASVQSAPQIHERVDFSDYYHGEVLQGDVDSFIFPRMDLVENFTQSLRAGCGDWNILGNTVESDDSLALDENGNPIPDGAGGFVRDCAKGYEDLNNRLEGPFAPFNVSSSNEKRTEAYIRGDFEFEELPIPLRGNLGLRYVSYELESTGFRVLPNESARGSDSLGAVIENDYPDLYALASGESTQSTIKGTDYSTVLPSLNLNFGLTEDIVLRLAASKGLHYPSLTQTRNSMIINLDYQAVLEDPSQSRDEDTNPVIDITDVEISAIARNAYLEPEKSTNYDVSLEWYFAPAGAVTLALFHKKLENIIRDRSFTQQLDYAGNSYPVSAYGPDNTGSGTIRGAELSYSQFYDFLPGAWSGLGMQFNFTYIDQNGLQDPLNEASSDIQFTSGGNQVVDNRNTFRVFSGLPLQGYSDKNMNVVGMYEYEDISFRLAYTWRSEYLLTRRESEEFVPTYTGPADQVDASLYYTINDVWQVGIEGSNLLREDTETKYQMDQVGTLTPALNFTTDRRYALSLRATF